MGGPIQAAVAVDALENRERVESVLAQLNGVEIAGIMHGGNDGFAGIPEPEADVLVFACGPGSENALPNIETAVRDRPDRPVVVVFEGGADGLVDQAFEVGAEDIFALPATMSESDAAVVAEQLAFTIQKAVARRNRLRNAALTETSRMICVLGPKGGSGKTLTTTNLAIALSAHGQRVLALDIDLQFGDLGLAMGLEPRQTIYDLARSSGSLDSEKVAAYLVRHVSGVEVLLAPTRPDHASAITGEFLRELFPVVRQMADFVIIDTPPGFPPEVIAAIDASSDVCMVCSLDTLSLKNMKLGLETLALMGYEQDRVKLLLNRADSNVGLSRDAVVSVIGRNPDVFVPSHRDVVRAVNSGTPVALSPNASPAGVAFHHLARLYMPVAAQSEDDSEERGRFGLRRRG